MMNAAKPPDDNFGDYVLYVVRGALAYVMVGILWVFDWIDPPKKEADNEST